MAVNVLICDDSKLARKQVNKSLPQGWSDEVQFATNGQEALDVLKSSEIDVLFLDLTMPVLDGIGTLQEINKQQLKVVTVVISADYQPEMQAQVQQLGAIAFIKKPVNPEKLAEVLHEYGLL